MLCTIAKYPYAVYQIHVFFLICKWKKIKFPIHNSGITNVYNFSKNEAVNISSLRQSDIFACTSIFICSKTLRAAWKERYDWQLVSYRSPEKSKSRNGFVVCRMLIRHTSRLLECNSGFGNALTLKSNSNQSPPIDSFHTDRFPSRRLGRSNIENKVKVI